jgi:FAD/FMN-containing dehydrogenase
VNVQGSAQDRLIRKLTDLVGAARVLTSAEERRFHAMDFSEQPFELPLAVVQPTTTDEVVEIVKAAAAAGVALNVRGGGISYTRAHVPVRPDTIVMDLLGLNRIVEINTKDSYVVLEPGVTWAQLRAALAPTGYRVPYLGTVSGAFATVGGGLSQNATGLGRGTLAEHVLGLEVVLGDGRVITTGSAAMRGTAPFYRYNGPDLTGVFLCDSGSFGIKTKASLLLERVPQASFGCLAFDEPLDMVRAQADFARSGLAAECFGFSSAVLEGMASGPFPSKSERLRVARSILAASPNKLRALRSLWRAWHPSGLGFLKGHACAMYFVAESFTQADADRKLAALEKIGRSFDGKRLPSTLGVGLRYGPFPQDIGDLISSADGEVSFPINAKFPASRIVEATEAFDRFCTERQDLFRRHRIRIQCNWLTHGHFCGIEPLIYWRKPPSDYRIRYMSDERVRSMEAVTDDEEATAAVLCLRTDLTNLFRSMGSLHVQWGKSYPYQESLSPDLRNIMAQIKDVMDPGHVLNPGVLGLN